MSAEIHHMSQTYVPIDCEFHDVLEAVAVRRRVVSITYLEESGQRKTVESRIADIYAKDAMEFMRLDDDSVIRLDLVVDVDGVDRSAFSKTCAIPARPGLSPDSQQ